MRALWQPKQALTPRLDANVCITCARLNDHAHLRVRVFMSQHGALLAYLGHARARLDKDGQGPHPLPRSHARLPPPRRCRGCPAMLGHACVHGSICMHACLRVHVSVWATPRLIQRACVCIDGRLRQCVCVCVLVCASGHAPTTRRSLADIAMMVSDRPSSMSFASILQTCTPIPIYRQAHRDTDRHTDTQTGTQTHRQAHRHTDRQTNTQTPRHKISVVRPGLHCLPVDAHMHTYTRTYIQTHI
jgi:hypothetical protein